MRIAIGCDDIGFPMKTSLIAALESDGHVVLDLGSFSTDPVDYPDYARVVGQAVLRGFAEAGVLVCVSGVGASIAANKLRGVRAAFCPDVATARQSREQDDANVLCLSVHALDAETAAAIAKAWIDARFSAVEPHARRAAKIAQLEEGLPAPEKERASPPARDARPAPAPVTSGNGHGNGAAARALGSEGAFAGALLDLSAAAPDAQRLDAEEKQEAVAELINAYRIRGHLFANIDPLGLL